MVATARFCSSIEPQAMCEGGAAWRFAEIEQSSPRTGSVLSEHEDVQTRQIVSCA